jgi:16S rRNA C967 or C1407 C5-methylase (RsmB/RsmF family)
MATPLPEEFVCSMREMLGAEAESLFEALDTPAEVSIRVNPAKSAETFEGEAVGWSK